MKEKAEVRLTEDMKRVLNEQRLGFIASVCQDGTPNLSPKGTTTVWDDEHIRSLLVSIARDFPIGSIMLLDLRPLAGFALAPVEDLRR